MRIFENTNYDFLGKRRKFYFLSLGIIILGIISFIIRPIPLGIDFLGGTEVQVRFASNVEVGEIRSIMEGAGFTGMEIKTMDSDRDILLRTPLQAEGTKISDDISTALRNGISGNTFEVLRTDKVGPKIGEELRRNALYAIIFSLIGILVYLSFRFQFIYAMGAVAALFHDVLITIAAIAISNMIFPGLNLEFNQTMLAAFLTLIGFSVNDTVVIFDRIRENVRLYKNEEIESVMNKSVNATLSRTVITGGTVFLTLIVIFIFGGEVLRSFAFTFAVGVLTGTYSSIFVASAVVVDWKSKIEKREKAAKLNKKFQTAKVK
ncbi:MAG TPA: protein translocase subunit SecF [Bacteroidetes bacterium]|nr:protein translocase subunit SecF [Ignavibacteria bacterium]HCA42904.1 protein translocase subunit SecF [Bacteroidota bacterium]HCN37265.1 protein translocase subunit SecF [Bacteroidota bacterium]